MRISRRTLIGGSVLATGIAAAGGYRLLLPVVAPETAIARFIADRVPQVDAEDQAVAAFGTDAVVDMRGTFENFEEHIILISNPALVSLLPAVQAGFQSSFERFAITMFMRSTDLLLDRAPGAPLTYLGYADPYTAACSNPLATLA